MPPRRHIAWIACLAVLFNLLAMPLSSAAPKGPAEQLLWGAFCSSMANKGKVDVQALAKIDLGPQSDDSASLMNCWCCSGAAPLLALPGYPPQLHNPTLLLGSHLAPPAAYTPTPRQLWPALNPRASPIV
ncbi:MULTISPECIES: DUF2946 domain-containing protein [Pseudomonas]|uniref:DUF2946 domain-containing protein n=1 Tax=Pseudomonas putida TaxID=303 RepID=A0A6S5E1C4_PSEPU|nr:MULTISPECIES: DUF2946 domain-containing protein [Pseudomonas]MDM9592284.1 DUF2946 domain-containing protein [Pseudomonas guariconensis]MDM9605111.1 DUF2946 domain-containing protein [Pseudomonas guariconensis]MDM9610068.1 DUF2946 domain-containing protein [Pseudomonas guariconensis]URD43246.1 DUF2946 domain-containing protein [Pseudomonas sp. BYT-5]URK98590.1 DUF2946 domain-containing protein [Pseudomonas sp. BYT-1]